MFWEHTHMISIPMQPIDYVTLSTSLTQYNLKLNMVWIRQPKIRPTLLNANIYEDWVTLW